MYNNIWTPFNINNGLVSDINDYNPLSIINDNYNNNTEKATNVISRNTTNSTIADIYFSNDNIEYLQNQIIKEVYRYSDNKYKIGKQSYNELKIIMRSYYLQYSKNLPTKIEEQIQTLNNMVIEWSVNNIINNIKQHDIYLETISTLPIPIERSQLPSQKGTRTLEIKSFI